MYYVLCHVAVPVTVVNRDIAEKGTYCCYIPPEDFELFKFECYLLLVSVHGSLSDSTCNGGVPQVRVACRSFMLMMTCYTASRPVALSSI